MNLARARMPMVVAMTAIAAAVTLAWQWHGSPAPRIWFWIVACLAGEAMWFRLPPGNATLSMGSCINLAALLVLPPHEAMVATALASFAAEHSVMRKPPIRSAYNASHTALAVGLAGAAFMALGGPERDLVALLAAGRLLPFIGAALTYYAVNRVAVCLAVALHDRTGIRDAWARNFGNAYEVLSSGAVFSLGILLALHYAGVGMIGTFLVLLPLYVAFDGYRRFSERHRDGSVPAREEHREAA